MPNFLDIYGNKQIQLTESEDLGYRLFTFTPVQLSNIKLSIESELLQLLIDAHRKLAEVKGIFEFVDDNDFIVNLFRINEAISSCRIDHIHVNHLDLFINNKQTDASDITKVKKYCKAMRFTKTKSLTQKSLCDLHASIMADDEIEYWENWQRDFLGNIRTVQTHLALEKGFNVVNVLKYNPTPPNHLQNLFDEMLEYYNKSSTYDILIKSALLHYQFESLHPFLGGNGRVGRLLTHKALINSGLANYAILPFSEYLAQDKVEYFDRLWSAQFSEKLIPWVKYFLKGIIYSSELTIQRLKRYFKTRKNNMDAIANCGSCKTSIEIIYKYLEKNIVTDIKTVAEVLSVSFNTANKIVNLLVEIGVLRALDDKKRYKVYVYSAVPEILT